MLIYRPPGPKDPFTQTFGTLLEIGLTANDFTLLGDLNFYLEDCDKNTAARLKAEKALTCHSWLRSLLTWLVIL